MSDFLKMIFSMSLSGALLIMALFSGRPLYRERFSRRWQYYVWLVVIARLLLPFTPKVSLMGTLLEQTGEASGDTFLSSDAALIPAGAGAESFWDPAVETGASGQRRENASEKANDGGSSAREKEGNETVADIPAGDGSGMSRILFVLWAGTAIFLLIRKTAVYRSFVKCIRAGSRPVTDEERLELLARTGAEAGVKRPVELYVNGQICSPLLLGVFRPCIVLPVIDLTPEDFRFTVLHELIHYRRKDLSYKWLIQITCCLHWFNPAVWLMRRELERVCEQACDEAVIRSLKEEERRAYGDTLLRAVKNGGIRESSLAFLTLSESGKQLKERLSAIMNFKIRSAFTVGLSIGFAALLSMGALAAGAVLPGEEAVLEESAKILGLWEKTYPLIFHGEQSGDDGAGGPETAGNSAYGYREAGNAGEAESNERKIRTGEYAALAEECYKEGSLSYFGAAFAMLDGEEQIQWLERLYEDGMFQFFSAGLNMLRGDVPGTFAEKAYEDESIVFFSILTRYMDEETLTSYADRALQDGRMEFQVMLLGALGRDFEAEELEAEAEKRMQEEYARYNIFRDGKTWYYDDRMIRVFMDIRSARGNSYTCMMNMNPLGTIDIKITRDAEGKIENVGEMSEAEVRKLFGEMPALGN